jgi:WD40 repeat protein
VSGRLRRWRQRLAGPLGRRLLLALALAAAWLAWLVVPPRPLREWYTTAIREPDGWRLSPDRTRLVCVKQYVVNHVLEFHPGTVRLWDLANGREQLTVRGDRRTMVLTAGQFTADGCGLLIMRQRKEPEEFTLELWDTTTGRERWSTPIGINLWTGQDDGLVVSPDGRLVTRRRDDGTGDVLLMETGEVRFTLGHAWPLVFARDGRTLVTVDAMDGADARLTVTLWDTATGRPGRRFRLKHPWPAAAALSPDGRWLAVGTTPTGDGVNAPGRVELWDTRTGEHVRDLLPESNWYSSLHGLTFSPDGTLLVALSPVGQQVAWDMRQQPPRRVDIQGNLHNGRNWIQIWVRDPLPDEADYPIFAPDGARFVGPSADDRTLAFRETATPDRVTLTAKNVQPMNRPEFAPDSRTLAVLHSDWYMPLWQQAVNWAYQTANQPAQYLTVARSELVFFDATTGAVRGQLNDFPNTTLLIGYSPDGRTVWTMTYVPDLDPMDMDAIREGTLRVQEWAIPTGWPPLWLVALTTLGVVLVVADWRHSRRRSAMSVRTGVPAA